MTIGKTYTKLFFVSLLWLTSLNTAAKISAQDFFKGTNTLSAQLSPDGNYASTVSQKGDDQHLSILNTRTKKQHTLIELSSLSTRESSIRYARWIGPSHLAIQFAETQKGIKNLLDTKSSYRLLIIELRKDSQTTNIYEVKTPGWLVHTLPKDSSHFLYAKSGIYSKVYKIDVSKLNLFKSKPSKLRKTDGGQFTNLNEIASVKGRAIRWFFGEAGRPESVLYFSNQQYHLGRVIDGATGDPIKTWTSDELNKKTDPDAAHGLLVPVELSKDSDTYYCLDSESDIDRTVYSCNFSTGEEAAVYQSDAYEIIDLIISEYTRELVGVKVLHEGRLQNHFIGKRNTDIHSNSTLFESAISSSLNNQVELVYRETHDQPGQYILRHPLLKLEKKIGSIYPHLDDLLSNRQHHKTVDVEGLAIPFILTLPNSVRSIPLVVMPHGGPIAVYDHQHFDLYTQFLVANGFAVLRVNFRGSSGYSPELEAAGKGQWGALMLKDIYHATKIVSQRKDIDESRVCSFGMSYGGYASLMMPILFGDTFHCAVSIAGITDLNLYLNSPYTTSKQDQWLTEQVGNSVEDYEKFAGISPAFLTQNLERPVFIMHGEKDDIVDIEHFFRLKLFLDKHSKPYEWKTFPEMGHSMDTPSTQANVFEAVLEFLQKQLRI